MKNLSIILLLKFTYIVYSGHVFDVIHDSQNKLNTIKLLKVNEITEKNGLNEDFDMTILEKNMKGIILTDPF